VLYVREVARDLALVCLMRAENLQRQGLVDYNVQILKQARARLATEINQVPCEPG